MTVPYSKRAATALLEERGWDKSGHWWIPPNALTNTPHSIKAKCYHRTEALVTELLTRGR